MSTSLVVLFLIYWGETRKIFHHSYPPHRMARRRSSARRGTFEIGLVLGTTLLSLTIVGLALIGIRFLSNAQSGSCDACHSMPEG